MIKDQEISKTDEWFQRKQSDKRTIKEFEPGSTYQTRGGEQVRVYAIEEKEIHGAVYHHGVWEVDTWNLKGKYSAAGNKPHPRDIILATVFKIKAGKMYLSKDGRPCKVFEVNTESLEFPVIGVIREESGMWVPRVWNLEGITKRPYGPNNDIVGEWNVEIIL